MMQQHTGTAGFFEMIREERKLRNEPGSEVKVYQSYPEERVAFPSLSERCEGPESVCSENGMKRWITDDRCLQEQTTRRFLP